MDNKLLEYKKILNLNVYALGRTKESFEGKFSREFQRNLPQRRSGEQAFQRTARADQPRGAAH